MNIRFISSIILLCLALPCMSSEKAELPTIRTSVVMLEASYVAFQQFRKDQPNADTKNFYTYMRETDTGFEIGFSPNPLPVKQGIGDDGTPFITIPNGRGNVYGRSILYIISKKDGVIIDTLYPK